MPYKNPALKKEYDAKRYQANAEKFIAYQRNLRETDPEKYRQQQRDRRRKNPEKFHVWDRASYQRNRSKKIAAAQKYYQQNRSTIVAKYREKYDPVERQRKRLEFKLHNPAKYAEWKRIGHKRDRESGKERARKLLRNAVRAGLIVKPSRCNRCKKHFEKQQIHGHHHDYGKPLDVQWLCYICHGKEHRVL